MELLREKAAQNGPLCIGLDTDPSYIPSSLLRKFPSKAEAVFSYNKAIISRIGDSACCCKVQIAYYEALGIEGMKAYSKTLKELKNSGIIAISDVKRGDIAATASAYARAHFSGDFESDIITVNPYMGFDTLSPFTEYCAEGKALFVLLRTSNPGMKDIENLDLTAGGKVLDRVGSELLRLSGEFKERFPEAKCSPVGAVVGCTEEADALSLREKYPDVFFLIPGYGAQGGTGKDLVHFFNPDGLGAIINSSRGIIAAYKNEKYVSFGPENYADASRQAVIDMREDIQNALDEELNK